MAPEPLGVFCFIGFGMVILSCHFRESEQNSLANSNDAESNRFSIDLLFTMFTKEAEVSSVARIYDLPSVIDKP